MLANSGLIPSTKESQKTAANSKSQNTKSTAASTLKTAVEHEAVDTFSSVATGIVSKQKLAGTDLRNQYCDRTKEAFNQFSKYTRFVKTDQLDLRCEFDLPRRKDLVKMIPFTSEEDHANFIWY